MSTLWFDCETFSECDLKAHSTHRYAEHPSTEITVAQWAIDDGDPMVWDCTKTIGSILFSGVDPQELRRALDDPTIEIVAHNSAFDRTLLRHCWGIDVPVERWRDTMVKALAHGLPGGLDKVGQVLGLEDDQAKDKRGKELIQLFCKPRPKGHTLRRATRETHPVEWAEFLEYSRQDIIAMRAVDRRLPAWNMRNDHPELALWHLDQRINDRGFAVDLDLAKAAIEAVSIEQARLKEAIIEETDGMVQNASKRDQLLAYILAEYGVDLPDMRADTLRRRLEDPELPEGVKLLLSIRLEATKTSTAKYKALVNATSADGRLRNTSQFCGASRTGRWAHRQFQPGNMPRGDMSADDVTDGIEALKGGFADIVFPNVMRLTANTVRGCIVAPPGKKLCVADLSNIEGRGLAYLAGEQWKLRAFAEFDASLVVDDFGRPVLNKKGERQFAKPDIYKLAYARSFNIDPKDVSKPQRQIGKVMELGLGYGGGVAAFLTFAAVYQMDLKELSTAVWNNMRGTQQLEDALGMWKWAEKKRRTLGLPQDIYVACEILKKAWRDAHPATVSLWASINDAMRLAIGNPGQTLDAGPRLKVRRDAAWLRMRLPSGRYLCYLQPKIDDDGQISYMGVDQYTRTWKRIRTYGGKGAEQGTQGFARDVFAHNATHRIEPAGYEIILGIHDEWLTETPDTDDFDGDKLAELLASPVPWAPGLPLAAAGFSTPRYAKG